ncbi:MAG TPA: EamA family transporter [Rudaea sp.]|nr:EamA family transporter [Rudaea sp.]
MKFSRPTAAAALAWAFLLGFETLCQISLKLAGRYTGEFDFSPAAFVRAASSPWLWTAVGCYIGAFLAWMTILRRSRLSAAFTTSALVFIAVMLASWLVFGEHIGWSQILGSAIIVAGILLIGDDGEGGKSVPPSTADPGPR